MYFQGFFLNIFFFLKRKFKCQYFDSCWKKGETGRTYSALVHQRDPETFDKFLVLAGVLRPALVAGWLSLESSHIVIADNFLLQAGHLDCSGELDMEVVGEATGLQHFQLLPMGRWVTSCDGSGSCKRHITSPNPGLLLGNVCICTYIIFNFYQYVHSWSPIIRWVFGGYLPVFSPQIQTPAPVGGYLFEANRYPQTGAGYLQTGTWWHLYIIMKPYFPFCGINHQG